MALVNIDLETEGIIKKETINRLYYEIDELKKEISTMKYYKNQRERLID